MRFLRIIIAAASVFLLLNDTVQALNAPITSINTNNNNNNNNNNNLLSARSHPISSLHATIQSSHSSLLSSLSSFRFRVQTYQDCLGALSSQTRTLDNVKGCLAVEGAASFDSNCKADINSAACAVDINAASKLYGVTPTNPGSSTLPQSCARAIAGGTQEDSDLCAKDLGLQALPASCFAKPPQIEKCISDVLKDLQTAAGTTTPAPATKAPPMWIPKSCLTIPPSSDSATRCGAEFGITVPASCAASTFQLTQCSIDISAAIAVKFNSGGSDTTSQCYQAIQSFSSNVNAKCKVIIDGLSSIAPTTPLSDMINSQCTLIAGSAYAECTASINQDAISTVQTACPNYNLGQIMASAHGIVSIIQGPITAICIQDDQDPTKTCLSQSLSGFNLFENNNFALEKINNDVLNNMCKPCIINVMNKLAALGGITTMNGGTGGSSATSIASSVALSSLSNSIKYLQLMCTKDPTDDTKYCMNVFSPIKTVFNKMTGGAVPNDDDFHSMCSPCITALITKLSMSAMDTIPGIDMELLKSLQKFCIKEPSTNKQCGTEVFNQQTALGTALIKCMGTTCSNECRTAVQELYNSQSCCFSTVGIQSMIPIISAVPSLKTFLPQVSAAASCVIDTSKSQCTVPIATVPIELLLNNIDATIANKALVNSALSAALKKDLSLLFGIDASAILIGAFSAATGTGTTVGTKVLITINIDASLQSSFQTVINNRLKKDGGIPLQNTAQTADANQAKIIDAQPVSASGNTAQPNTSNALSIMKGGSMIAISIITIVSFIFPYIF